MRSKQILFLTVFLSVSLCAATAQASPKYRIADVAYDIKGSTREFPLSQKVEIDTDRIFESPESVGLYIDDLEVKFSNVRVLESAKIDVEYGTPDANGVIPAKLTIHTVDTWNIIALPYPKFDSNSGYQLKLKIKNYNFFGSMEEMNTDLIYGIDNDGSQNLEGTFNFSIPFAYQGYAFIWSIKSSLIIPFGEVPEYTLTTGLDYALPLSFADLHFGVEQGMSVNTRDSDDELEDDRFFLTERVYTNLPLTLHEFEYVGKLLWTPELSINQNWNLDGIRDPDLTGPDFTVSHALSIGRFDWVGNFRKGFDTTVKNSYTYDFTSKRDWEISVSGSATGFATMFDRIGLNSRITGFYNFNDYLSDDVGDCIRGILDSRITTDSMVSLNIDLPVRIMRVNFEEITGVKWTRIIGFEMHASPFFDMALSHDLVTDRYYSLDDGWYSGGLEIIVYPLKMRSIYGRISAGFDIPEVIKSGKLSGFSERDGESIREIFVGIGLLY